jgi:hypothetical protein
MPSWDNTARVGRRAYLAVNSSPESYRSWLETVCNRTRRDLEGDERVVFINAWNEWGEGCHLEPDRRYGLNWLEATRAALSGASPQFSYTTAEDDRLLLREQIERLGRELGLDGAGAELVLKEAALRAQRTSADVARRDDVISALNEKLAYLTAALAAQQRGNGDGKGVPPAPTERLAS